MNIIQTKSRNQLAAERVNRLTYLYINKRHLNNLGVTENILEGLSEASVVQLEDQIAWDEYHARYNTAVGVLNASDDEYGVEFNDDEDEENGDDIFSNI